jgi:hypothetical protein
MQKKEYAFWRDLYFWSAFLISLFCLSRLYDFSSFSIFLERDLERGRLLAQGQPIFFGPELSGGGHLPGPFNYILLSIPYLLGLGWQGAWWLIVGMAALAPPTCYFFLRKLVREEEALLGAIFLLSLPQLARTIVLFQNFSFLPLFLTLMLGSLGACFTSTEEEERAIHWRWVCVAYALAVQLHASASFLMGVAILVQIIAPWIGLRRLSARSFFIGLSFIVVLLAPYFIWLTAFQHGMSWGQTPPGYVGSGQLNSFTRTIGSGLASQPIWLSIYSASTHWRKSLSVFSYLFSPLMLVPFVLLLFYRQRSDNEARSKQAFRIYLLCTVICIAPALVVLFSPHRSRYFSTLLFALPFLFSTGLSLCKLPWQGRKRTQVLASACVLAVSIFLVTNFKHQFHRVDLNLTQTSLSWMIACAAPLILVWRFYSRLSFALLLAVFGILLSAYKFKPDSRNGNGFTLPQLTATVNEVISRTGWSWEEARQRIFVINSHYQRTMGTVYRETWAKTANQSSISGPVPDGFLVISGRLFSHEEDDFIQMIKDDQDLPADLTQSLKDGKIRLEKPIEVPQGALAAYFINDKNHFPLSFQNIGTSYLVASPKITPKPSLVTFTFNDCPDHSDFCNIRFDVSHDKASRQFYVRVSGEVISQPSVWVSPNWTQMIYSPYLKIRCAGNEKHESFTIVSKIGSDRNVTDIRNLSGYILGPIERQISDPCGGGKVGDIEAGFKSSAISKGLDVSMIPGRSKTLSFDVGL